MIFFIDPKVTFGFGFLRFGFGCHALQHCGHNVDPHIHFCVVFGLPRNDQGRSGLINQYRVHLIDNREHQGPLATVFGALLHVVTQIVKAELIVRAIRNIRKICGYFFFVALLRYDYTHRQTKKIVETSHPTGIASREIIVHRHHMHTALCQRVEIDRQGCHQRFAFARAHLSNFAAVQDHATNQLHIKMTHAKHAHTCLAHNSKSFRQQGVKRSA